MPRLLKIPEAAAIGLHAVLMLVDHPDSPVTAHEIAEELDASEAHVAKVMQRLSKAGLVASTRGPKGGFMLKRPCESINMLEVYEAIEGPVLAVRCLFETPVCGGRQCVFGCFFQEIDQRLREFLAGMRLCEQVD